MVEAWLQDLSRDYPWALALIRVLLLVIPILILVPGCIWWERRFLSWMQDRIGPNRVGNIPLPGGRKIKLFGLLQPIADGVKLFLKEDITPSDVDRLLYFFAPALALFPAFMLGGTLPWGPTTGLYGYLTPVWDPEIGLLYVLAISSLGVYGVVLAGYASNNKYSLLGGLRSSAQLISYELAMSVALGCVVIMVGSLKMSEMVNFQMGSLWGYSETPVVKYIQNWNLFTPFGFIAAVIFLICMIAETNRAPFDLPEAENEIIAGYHTEYSSMKFAVFFMGEYAAMLIFGGLFAALFMGGFNPMPIRWDLLAADFPGAAHIYNGIGSAVYWFAPLFFLAKMAFMLSVYIWLRATLPRLRYDQLMTLGWKILLPAAVGNLIAVTLWLYFRALYPAWGGWMAVVLSLVVGFFLVFMVTRSIKLDKTSLEKRKVVLADGVGGAGAVPTEKSAELV